MLRIEFADVGLSINDVLLAEPRVLDMAFPVVLG